MALAENLGLPVASGRRSCRRVAEHRDLCRASDVRGARSVDVAAMPLVDPPLRRMSKGASRRRVLADSGSMDEGARRVQRSEGRRFAPSN